MKKTETIRAAVLRNRGGLEKATDSQIMIIWDSLTAKTQKQYLDSVKEEKVEKPKEERKVPDAVSNPSKRNLRDGP